MAEVPGSSPGTPTIYFSKLQLLFYLISRLNFCRGNPILTVFSGSEVSLRRPQNELLRPSNPSRSLPSPWPRPDPRTPRHRTLRAIICSGCHGLRKRTRLSGGLTRTLQRNTTKRHNDLIGLFRPIEADLSRITLKAPPMVSLMRPPGHAVGGGVWV